MKNLHNQRHMKLHKQFFFFATITCLLTILGSCMQTAPPPLRVGANVWPGYESLYLARDLGYYDNSSIQLVDYPSATEVSRALRNGHLEVAALTLDETLALAETNPDIRVVLVTDVSAGEMPLLLSQTLKHWPRSRVRKWE
jgi:NitT/TauT family transport system substrate-binding protein